ncbi:MAG: DUF5041 domain-containing protein [Saprospiraceae bacterium]|nr:DUF5041 domain-containing protein [Saprospiraceae bacterium]
MKTKTFSMLLLLVLVNFASLQAQDVTPDRRLQLLKEDVHNRYQSNNITHLDMLQALEFAGIQIMKFDLGQFDERFKLYLITETYENGKLVETDTILSGDNRYHYFQRAQEGVFHDYMDQLKFITKDDDNKSEIRLHTYKMSTKFKIELEKWDDRQFYNWRYFRGTHWQLNEKVPLMIFASSWKDKRYDFHRFCGRVVLEEGEEGTEELLQESPAYVLFSYIVSPMPEKKEESGDR